MPHVIVQCLFALCFFVCVGTTESRCVGGDLVPFLMGAANQSVGEENPSTQAPIEAPRHKIWRLNVPGSSSSNLYKRILKAETQNWEERLLGLPPSLNPNSNPTCDFELQLVGCSPEEFHTQASFVATAKQSQHADYKHVHDVFIPRWIEPGDSLFQMTMIRDPFLHFMRTYDKKSRPHGVNEKTFMFVPTWRKRNVTKLPDAEVPISEFAEKAFWKWNIFSRALTGNYSGGKLLNKFIENDNITREIAHRLNEEVRSGNSATLDLAKERLLSMSFFGIFELIEESMQLLAHTMCWDYTGLDFKKRLHKEQFPELERKPNGDPEQTEATIALIEKNNALDRELYSFARSVFEQRVADMNKDKSQNIICRFANSNCHIRRVPLTEHSADGEL